MNQKKYIFFILFIFFYNISTSCKKINMVIFVHGTIRPPEFSFASIIKIARDKIDNSLYSLAVENLRNSPSLFYGQPIQEIGLQKVDLESQRTAAFLGKIFNIQYFFHTPHKSNEYLYYTFGWNGLISMNKRQEAGIEFYKALCDEIKKLETQNIKPEITIITYSHGGNVALNLAKAQKEKHNYFLTIEKLIMFGLPVQRDTDYLINDQMFKKIYHIYSDRDAIQTADPFSIKQLFSNRTFRNRKDLQIHSKVKQIKIRIANKILGKHKLSSIPEQSYKILDSKLIRIAHIDPGHTELWNFSWSTIWYRKTMPINPLPIVAFTPSIIEYVDKYTTNQYITFDYVPQENAALISEGKYGKKQRKAIPFLTIDEYYRMQQIGESSEPLNFNTNIQKKIVSESIKQAREILKKRKKYKRPHNRTLLSYLHKIDKVTSH